MIPRTDGTLTISGKRAEISEFKKLIGYVPQDDIMVRELTIRDILLHASRVRLPKTWTDTKKMRYVDVVLEALDLTHVQRN
jgi:ABC-type multidrug transport system ATPase subunit